MPMWLQRLKAMMRMKKRHLQRRARERERRRGITSYHTSPDTGKVDTGMLTGISFSPPTPPSESSESEYEVDEKEQRRLNNVANAKSKYFWKFICIDTGMLTGI